MKHLKWGLLAAGGIAGKFAAGLNTITGEATALAVASRDRDKAAAFAETNKIAKAYGSYDELLADREVDAVYIATPNSLHAEWSIKAARAGKHILCEKPVTANAAQLERVLAEVEKAGVFFMEAFMYRCHPQWKQLREVLDAGTIGEVRLMDSRFCFNLGGQPTNIRMSHALAGGALMDVGCYCVSFFRFVARQEPVEMKAVAQIGAASGVDEYAAGTLRFESGILAKFLCSMQCAAPVMANVFGTAGSIAVTNPWFAQSGDTTLIVKGPEGEKTITVSSPHHLYAREALTVAENIDRRQSDAMSWDDSRGQARTLDALRESMGLRFEADGA